MLLRQLLFWLGIVCCFFADLIVAFCLADEVDQRFGKLGVEVLHDVLFLSQAEVC